VEESFMESFMNPRRSNCWVFSWPDRLRFIGRALKRKIF